MYGMFYMYFWIDFPTLKPNKPKKPKNLKKCLKPRFLPALLLLNTDIGGIDCSANIMSIHELYNEHSVCTDTRN